MAVVKAYVAVDFTADEGYWNGEVVETSSSEITISDGYVSVEFRGDFNYNWYGEVFGTLDSAIARLGDNVALEITQINRSMQTLGYLAEYEVTDALTAFLFSGGDTFYSSRFNDRVVGYIGADRIFGYGGYDHLSGSQGADRIFGGFGNDQLFGGEGPDLLGGDGGNDWLKGGYANDRLNGLAGDDRLWGDQGADVLIGFNGADQLDGGAGNDRIRGDLGRDTLIGGFGADRFVFNSVEDIGNWGWRDAIQDFSRAQSDKLDLRAIDASLEEAGDQAFAFIGAQRFSGTAGELMARAGSIWGDVDGDAAAEFRLEVANGVELAQPDILL